MGQLGQPAACSLMGHRMHARALSIRSPRLAQSTRQFAASTTQAVQKGDKLPAQIELNTLAEDGNKIKTTVGDVVKGKKIVLVGVPGAFTPVCSSSHIPGFISSAKQFAEKGVDYIGVLATNDIFVMREWAKSLGSEGSSIHMLSDGNCELAEALGLAADMSAGIMGKRTRRFAMYVNDGTVECLNVETGEDGGGSSDKSTSAEALLKAMA